MPDAIQEKLAEIDRAWNNWRKGNITAEELKNTIRKIDSEIKGVKRNDS